MSFDKLLAAGRLEPIIKYDGEGVPWLIGYRRKKGSRKAHQIWDLKEPRKLTPKKPAEAAT